jgi:TP901 family phage tail tape measure protein
MALGSLALLVGADISGLASAMQDLQTNVVGACTTAGKKIDGFSEKISGISGGAGEMMDGVTSTFGQFSNLIATALTNPITAAIAVIAGIGVAATEAGETFETASNTIERATGATGSDLDDLNTSASNLFSSLPASMETITSTIDTLHTKLGLTNDDLTNTGAYFVALGIDTGTPADQLANAAAGMANMWQIAANDVPGYMNQILAAAQTTGTSVSSLVQGMTDAGPMLIAMGMSFTDAAALIAQFGQRNVDAGTAMSGLRILFNEMSTQNIPDMRDQFFAIAAQIAAAQTPTDAMSEAIDLFGKRGGALGIALSTGAGNIDALAQKMQSGTTDAIAIAAATQTFSTNLTTLKNNLETILAPLGTFMLGLANDALTHLTQGGGPIPSLIQGLLDTKKGFTDTGAASAGMGTGMAAAGLAMAGYATNTTAAATATTVSVLGSKELAAQKAAEAAAVKAAAEQTQFETAQDKTANEMLDTRNATIDFFTKAAEKAKLSQEDWTTVTVDWGASTVTAFEGSTEATLGYSNIIDSAGTSLTKFGNFALDQVSSFLQLNDTLASVGVTSEDLANTKLNDLNNKLAQLKQGYDDGTISLVDYTNGSLAAANQIQELSDKINPLNTLLNDLGQNKLTAAQAASDKLTTALAALTTNTGGLSDSMSPSMLQLTIDNVNQKLADAAAASDGLGTAYGNLNIKTAAQWAAIEKTNTDSIKAIVDATDGAADPNNGTLITAWTSYYTTKLADDKANNLSLVANDQAMLDSLKQQETIAIDAGSGTLTGLWSDYYKAITTAETTFATTVATDLFSGSGSLFSKLGTALTDLGKNIATAFVTDAVDRFVKFVTANLLQGTLFSSLATAFQGLGTTVSSVFAGIQTDFSNLAKWIGGGTGNGATGLPVTLPGVGGGATTGGGVPINIPTGGTVGAGTGTIPIIGGGTDPIGSATDVGDGGVISIGDAGAGAAGDAGSSASGLTGAISGLGGILTGAVSGLISGAITAIDNTILQHQQDKIFENIQNDTDLLREWFSPGGWVNSVLELDMIPLLAGIWANLGGNTSQVARGADNAAWIYAYLQTWVVDNALTPMAASLASIDKSTKTLASMSWQNTINISISDISTMVQQISQQIVTNLQMAGLKVS